MRLMPSKIVLTKQQFDLIVKEVGETMKETTNDEHGLSLCGLPVEVVDTRKNCFAIIEEFE